jgi:hypothetical protein
MFRASKMNIPTKQSIINRFTQRRCPLCALPIEDPAKTPLGLCNQCIEMNKECESEPHDNTFKSSKMTRESSWYLHDIRPHDVDFFNDPRDFNNAK